MEILVPAELAKEVTRVAVTVDPDALYDAPSAAVIIDIEGCPKYRQTRMYQIPATQLRRIPIGPNGGRYRWRGSDLLEYRKKRRGDSSR